MNSSKLYGYAGMILIVDLTSRQFIKETIDEDVLKKYLGGMGLGAYYLYEYVQPGIEWFNGENTLIITTGPVTGTAFGGSGGFMVVTKGAITKGAAASQANGFLGAYLKRCGYDAIIFKGKANQLSYVYIHEEGVELKNASHLSGKNTWDTERMIHEELGKRESQLSVYSIGVAGEHLVKFACIVGDRGHSASHGGVGAVMGSKNLKAIAVARGKHKVAVSDEKSISKLNKEQYKKVEEQDKGQHQLYGTLGYDQVVEARRKRGITPVKNFTTNIWPKDSIIKAATFRSNPQFKTVWKPCWACRLRHCHLIEILDGPFTGFIGEEPDYEPFVGFTSFIDNADPIAATVLTNEVDRLGMDANESAFLVAWLMECYEKGLLNSDQTCGLELNWGNVVSTRILLQKIAQREEFGDVLAEGLKSAAEHIGGSAKELAVYCKKGHTLRMHDERSSWPLLLDTVTSERGRDMDSAHTAVPRIVGLQPETDLFTPSGSASLLARVRGRYSLGDSMVVCRFNVFKASRADLTQIVNAATGWNFSTDETRQLELRIVNLLRAFNIRHGHSPELEMPSARYRSAPIDGPHKGKSIAPVWDEALNVYYREMGWDRQTGKPLPDTLRRLELNHIISDLWA